MEKLKRYEEAIQSCNRALEIQPDYHEAWHQKGYILYQLGKHQESSEAITLDRLNRIFDRLSPYNQNFSN